ncbi:MAG: hypothetical protein RIT14_965 [Pseudomonadota bacterium]
MTGGPGWQSLLFVPVGAGRHLASAIRHRPDAVILDLEDAIPAAQKAAARAQLPQDLAALAEAGIAAVVRVNAPLPDMVRDLAAAGGGALAAVLVPKVEDPRAVLNAAELSGVGVIALIETPAALDRLGRIARTPGLVGLMLGSEDYSAALGIDPQGGGLDLPAGMIAAAAAACGVLAIGFPGSIAEFRDLDRYGANLRRGRALGMAAVAAIHPAQLPLIRQIMAPTEAEQAWAGRVLAALPADGGVAALDGAMIDAPVLARARRILARAGA